MVTKIVTTWSSCVWNGILPQHTSSFVWYAHNYIHQNLMDNIYALGKLFTSEWTDKVIGQISRRIFVPNWGYCWYMLHIHISYTSYQKGNVFVLRKRLMNDLKLFFLVKVPLATCLHQWNTVGFLWPWLVRLMKDQVIRHGTLQVSKSNRMLLHLYLTNELQTTLQQPSTMLHKVCITFF